MAFLSGQRVTIQGTIVRQVEGEATYTVVLCNGLLQNFDLFELKADDDLPPSAPPTAEFQMMEKILMLEERLESQAKTFWGMHDHAMNKHECILNRMERVESEQEKLSELLEESLGDRHSHIHWVEQNLHRLLASLSQAVDDKLQTTEHRLEVAEGRLDRIMNLTAMD